MKRCDGVDRSMIRACMYGRYATLRGMLYSRHSNAVSARHAMKDRERAPPNGWHREVV